MEITGLRPLQAAAAALFFKHKKLLLVLPRQFGGKTELGVRLAEDLTRRPFTSSCLFIAKNAGARKKATREKFMRLFDDKIYSVNTEIVYNKKYPSSQIFMASIDKDPGAQRGGTHNFVHWSEVAFSKIELGETIIDVFLKVVRPMIGLKEGYALLETTLNGNNGFKDLWDRHEEFGFARFKVSFSQMLELGLITQAQYDKEKSETLPMVFQQEYECEFVTFLGKVYEEFDERRHVIAEIPPPPQHAKVIMAIDWGWSPSANCILFGYVQDGIIHVFDEIYEKEQLLEETLHSINARLSRWGIDDFAAVADHELDRIEELNRRGIPCTPADKVNVLGNRIEIKELFWKDKIIIHPRCQYLIKDLGVAVWHEKKEGDLDYSQCTYGHLDAEASLRYLVRAFKDYEAPEPIINPHITTDDAAARAWQLERTKPHDN